jgi:hypothetical protein
MSVYYCLIDNPHSGASTRDDSTLTGTLLGGVAVIDDNGGDGD